MYITQCRERAAAGPAVPIHSLKEVGGRPHNNRHTPTDAHTHYPNLNPLPPSSFPSPLTRHPKFPLPLLSNCVHWRFPEARSLRCRSPLASSFWLLWRGGKGNPGRFVRHFVETVCHWHAFKWNGPLMQAPSLHLLQPLVLFFLLWERERERGR